MPTTWDLFCGCGGMSLGFEQAGFSTKFAFDWERDQAATFAINRPGVPVLRMDVRQMNFKEIVSIVGRPDVLAGGPPCQGFSSASKPLDDSSVRAPKRSIYFHAIRALGEAKPQLFFFENSPNVATQYSKPVFNALRKAGREAKFVILAAKDFGVPQVRRRAFLIDPAIEPPTPTGSIVTPRKAFAGLSKPSESGKDELHRPRNATKEFTARIARAKPGGFLYQNPNNPKQPWSYTNVRIHPDRPTMSVNSVGDFCHFSEARKLTFREYLRLQCMPDTYKFFFSTPSNMRILVARILPPPFAKAWAEKINAALSKKQKMDLPDLTDHEWELIHTDFEDECQKIDTRVIRSVPDDVEDIVVSAVAEITPKSLRKLDETQLHRLNRMTHKLHSHFFAQTERDEACGIQRDDLLRAQACIVDEMFRCEMSVDSETELNRELTIKAVWTRAFINDLPDSAFLYVAPGGKKDADGKTVPRSLRYFPVRDDEGKLDLPHLRNALARIPQAKLPKSVKDEATRKARKLLEDAKEKQESKSESGCVGNCSNCQSCDDSSVIKLLPIDKVDDDRRIVYGVVLEPNTVDSQGDTISAAEIERAAHIWLARFQNRGLMHRRIINSKIEIYESYIATTNLTIGGQKVKKGTWLLMYHVLDEELWKDIKSGKLAGFSMGGRARRVPDKLAA